ncbi:hypothetical protein LX32DRAFT_287296 [Colletotrichum zoysiae]|uniref:Uncharacterized protein n=1 Tax=Colletotrichum zoysiae TaxID=1216348 RepID=A0AAD9H3X1_9PEZI|nr:hypothetical protein LX32DRAFT_287296 [Colletotrichum zoysiae]
MQSALSCLSTGTNTDLNRYQGTVFKAAGSSAVGQQNSHCPTRADSDPSRCTSSLGKSSSFPSFPFPSQSKILFISSWSSSVGPCPKQRLSEVSAFLASRQLMHTTGTRFQFRDDPRESAGCRSPESSPLAPGSSHPKQRLPVGTGAVSRPSPTMVHSGDV